MKPTIERLRELFFYDPVTGEFKRKIAVRGKNLGDGANPDSYGYLRVKVDGTEFQLTHVIWAMHYGAWPDHEIDHENRVRADNRILNLRPANRAEQSRNTGLRKDNRSGYKGVTVLRRGGFVAKIKAGVKRLHIGTFRTAEEAAHAYNKAAVLLHGEFAVLNPVGGCYVE